MFSPLNPRTLNTLQAAKCNDKLNSHPTNSTMIVKLTTGPFSNENEFSLTMNKPFITKVSVLNHEHCLMLGSDGRVFIVDTDDMYQNSQRLRNVIDVKCIFPHDETEAFIVDIFTCEQSGFMLSKCGQLFVFTKSSATSVSSSEACRVSSFYPQFYNGQFTYQYKFKPKLVEARDPCVKFVKVYPTTTGTYFLSSDRQLYWSGENSLKFPPKQEKATLIDDFKDRNISLFAAGEFGAMIVFQDSPSIVYGW